MAGVWEIVDVLVTFIKGVLIIGGSVASAGADVVLGALTLALLLVNTAGATDGVKFAPVMISMAASGIQLILWQIVQNNGGMRKIWHSGGLAIRGAFALVILMKFADDFMDVSIVNHLMVGSILSSSLGSDFYRILQGMVMFIVWVVTGFSEIFVVSAIEIMKINKPAQAQPQQNHYHPKTDDKGNTHSQQYSKPKHTPPFIFGDETREYFSKRK